MVYLEKIKEIENLLDIDYNSKGDLVPIENLTTIIEDLLKELKESKYKIEEKEEEIKDIREDIKYNYKFVGQEED